jgi:uncharacterized repeat protein (TIGR01451 family)
MRVQAPAFALASLVFSVFVFAAPQQPTPSKSFTPSAIVAGQLSTLSFTIANPNSIPLTNLSLPDTLPNGLIVATPNGLTGSCGGGTITANAGTSVVNLFFATLPANSSCSYSVNVTTKSPPVLGKLTNTTATMFTNETGVGPTASAILTVNAPQQPTPNKSFSPSTIVAGQTSTLTFAITNPNPVPLTNLSLPDTLPSGLIVATPNGLTGSCGGGTITATAGTNVVNLFFATLSANSSCSYSVNVTTKSPPVLGKLTNTTATIFTNETSVGPTASASITVTPPQQPMPSKSFSPSTIVAGQTSTLTFTITNPNPVPLTNLSLPDTFPAGLVVANPNGLTGSCGGGTITANPGDPGISLFFATLAPNTSCVYSVKVTSISPPVFGPLLNTTKTIFTNELGNGPTASATLTVVPTPPTINKAFGAASVPLGGTTALSFTISNPNTTVALTGLSFTDTLPSGLVVSTPNNLIGSCGGGSISATAGSNVISLTGATLAASGSCTFSVNVTGTAPGTQSNSVIVNSDNAGASTTATAILAVLAPPTITKSFADAEVQLFSGSTAVTFTLSNPSGNPLALTGVAFTDTLPAGLAVQVPDNGLVGSCDGGTITAVPGSNSISLSGATLPVNGSCTFSVVVQGIDIGTWLNTTSAVTSTNGGTGLAASDTTSVDDLFFLWFFL